MWVRPLPEALLNSDSSISSCLSAVKADKVCLPNDERLNFFVKMVKATFTAMRFEQRPYIGSVCSKRLQDRMEWDYPEEYALFVNNMFNRSWDRFLESRADIVCYPHNEGSQNSNTKWLMAHGSLRCRLLSEELECIVEGDELLGRMIRNKCVGDLEDTCRCILMEVFFSIVVSDTTYSGYMRQNREKQYHLGGLSLWEPIIYRLWVRQVAGGGVRLRDMERPSQQLGFHIRLRCRWTELLGNNLLAKCVAGSVLRVLLNVERPEMSPLAGVSGRQTKSELIVQLHKPSGKLVVVLAGTKLWGWRPSHTMANFIAEAHGET
uniref:Uncharacterized protein TCIL3000_9_2310 n=1 Tax=Trypanosoma congolense (strain IL3000) TaxID=1068625 RepID=G0UTX0_TRYCI|nr:unnamed protein product [Trypanosoma congolense IL3000]